MSNLNYFSKVWCTFESGKRQLVENMDRDTQNTASDQMKSAVSGGLSGAMTRSICQPLDVLKIRFQLQVENDGGGAKYRSIFQAVKLMYREEGLKIFWRGHNPAQVLSIAYGISQFWFYEQINFSTKHIRYFEDHDEFRHFMCGAAAGTFATIIANPIDVVRTRLIAQDRSKGYKNSVQGLKVIIREESFRGLFRGLGPSLLQIAPMSGSQFMFYNFFGDSLKSYLHMSKSEMLPAWELLIVGGLTGCCAKFIVYPLDLAKKRMQIQGFGHHRKSFGKHFVCNGLLDCISMTARNEGLKALYKGLYPTMLKSGATTALHFVFYDEIVKFLSSK